MILLLFSSVCSLSEATLRGSCIGVLRNEGISLKGAYSILLAGRRLGREAVIYSLIVLWGLDMKGLCASDSE